MMQVVVALSNFADVPNKAYACIPQDVYSGATHQLLNFMFCWPCISV